MPKTDREYIKNVISEIKDGLDEIRSIVAIGLENFMRSRDMRFAMRYSII